MNIKKIVSIILVVVSVALIAVGVYIMNSNKYIFSTALSKSMGYITSTMDKITSSEISKMDKYKLTTDNKIMFNEQNLLSLAGDIYHDNDRNYFMLNSSVADEDFLEIEGLLQDNKIYFKISEVMSNFYYQDFSFDSTQTFTSDDLSLLLNHLKQSITKDLTNKDFKRSKQTLTLDNEKFNTTKISLDFTDKVLYETIKNLLESIIKDNKAITVLQKVNKDITKDTLQQLLDQFNGETPEMTNETMFTITLYVGSANKPLRCEIVLGQTSEPDSVMQSGASLIFDSYSNKSNNKVYALELVANGSTVMRAKSEEENKTTTKLLLEMNSDSSALRIEGASKTEGNDTTLHLDVFVDEVDLGDLIVKSSTITKSKEYSVEVTVSITNEGDSISLVSKNNFNADNDIPAINVSTALPYSEMSESEQSDIDSYIYDQLEKLGLDQFTNNYIPSDNDDYDSFYWSTETTASSVEYLISSDEPVILWFGSGDSSECKNYSDVLDESMEDYFYTLYYINTDDLTSSDRSLLASLDSKLNVTSVPTVVVMQDSRVVDELVGVKTLSEYTAFLDQHGIEKW